MSPLLLMMRPPTSCRPAHSRKRPLPMAPINPRLICPCPIFLDRYENNQLYEQFNKGKFVDDWPGTGHVGRRGFFKRCGGSRPGDAARPRAGGGVAIVGESTVVPDDES